MSHFLDDLKRLPLKRNHRQSRLTRANRSAILGQIGKQLLELGYTDLTVTGLEDVHITALLALWEEQGLTVATRANRLSILRWWARLIEKEGLIAKNNAAYNLLRAQHSAPTLSGKLPTEDIPRKRCTLCKKVKLLTEFVQNQHRVDGRTETCLACNRKHVWRYDLEHREQKRAYDAAHKQERRDRDKRRNDLEERMMQELGIPVLPCTACAYLIQLARDLTLVKIGQTLSFRDRSHSLQEEYGHFQVVMLIPHEKPVQLERKLHSYFEAMRIYNGASSTELFRFDTRAKQRILERFLTQYPTLLLNMPQWTQAQTQNICSENLAQGTLFGS